jgi:hypothetical protein
MISLNGRQVPGFALGNIVAPDLRSTSEAELTLMRADAAQAKTIADYKTVGQFGAETLGPDIDNVGPAEVTQPFTHRAWETNKTLAATTDIVQARNLVDLMLNDYQQALAASRKKETSGGWTSFFIPLGALVLIGGVWYLVR